MYELLFTSVHVLKQSTDAPNTSVFFVLNGAQAHNETVLTSTNHACKQGKQWKEACTAYFMVKKKSTRFLFWQSHNAKTYHHSNCKNYFGSKSAADISLVPFTDFSGNHSHTLYMCLIFYTVISRWCWSPKVSSLIKCVSLMRARAHTHTRTEKTLLATLSPCVLIQTLKRGKAGGRGKLGFIFK